MPVCLFVCETLYFAPCVWREVITPGHDPCRWEWYRQGQNDRYGSFSFAVILSLWRLDQIRITVPCAWNVTCLGPFFGCQKKNDTYGCEFLHFGLFEILASTVVLFSSWGAKRYQSILVNQTRARECEGGLRPVLHQYRSSARPSSHTGVPAQISSDWSNFFASIQSLTWSTSPSLSSASGATLQLEIDSVQMHWACAPWWLSVDPLRACRC